MELLGLDLCVLAWRQFVGCCERGHSPFASATCREFLDYLEEVFLSEKFHCAIELVSCNLSLFEKKNRSDWIPYRVHNGPPLDLILQWLSPVHIIASTRVNPLNPELNPICYLLALLGAHHFLHVNRIRVKSLTLRLLMSYIYGAHILDVSRSNTTTQHSR